MKAHASIRPQAVRDIDGEAAYLAGQRAVLGYRFHEATRETMQLLAEMPTIGSRSEIKIPRRLKRALADLRVWPVKGFRNHLIFYRPVESGIEVVRVVHGARNIDASFFE